VDRRLRRKDTAPYESLTHLRASSEFVRTGSQLDENRRSVEPNPLLTRGNIQWAQVDAIQTGSGPAATSRTCEGFSSAMRGLEVAEDAGEGDQPEKSTR
jgi:hypothetical protein